MIRERVQAAAGKRPFDVLIRHLKLVNVFDGSIAPGCLGLTNGFIAYAGPELPGLSGLSETDGHGLYALPGFVDAHMHLESSMLSPSAFAAEVLQQGTTTVCADPHEICNVLGAKGVLTMRELTKDLPLRVLLMAPSTVPSAPGLEGSGAEIGPEEMASLLKNPDIFGVGEVMHFNGVADAEPDILSVIEEGARRGVLIDGHASLLTGRRLQAFRAAGIHTDHTIDSAEKLREVLALGFYAQIQLSMLTPALCRVMEEISLDSRICLVTDDVPLDRLMEKGHLNYVVRRAIELGLSPMKAIRFATLNPSCCLRQYELGALGPGMRADIQLIRDISAPEPEQVWINGQCLVKEGTLQVSLPAPNLTELTAHSMHLPPLKNEDFACRANAPDDTRFALVNTIHQDGVHMRTTLREAQLPLIRQEDGCFLGNDGFVKMCVFNRYGIPRHGTAFVDMQESFSGAVALTYGHDAHNLSVFGSNDADMALCANAVIESGGGLAAAQNGQLLCCIPLPLAGLMSLKSAPELQEDMSAFLGCCRDMGFVHQSPLVFFTMMALAVSPEVKCTDMGLADTAQKKLLPLIKAFL